MTETKAKALEAENAGQLADDNVVKSAASSSVSALLLRQAAEVEAELDRIYGRRPANPPTALELEARGVVSQVRARALQLAFFSEGARK